MAKWKPNFTIKNFLKNGIFAQKQPSHFEKKYMHLVERLKTTHNPTDLIQFLLNTQPDIRQPKMLEALESILNYSEPGNGTEILKFANMVPNKEEQNVTTLLRFCMDDYEKTENVSELFYLYANLADYENAFKENILLKNRFLTELAKYPSELVKFPNELAKYSRELASALGFSTTDSHLLKTYESIFQAVFLTQPPQSIENSLTVVEALGNILSAFRNMYDDNSPEIKVKKRIYPLYAFKKINDQMENMADNDLAYKLLELESSYFYMNYKFFKDTSDILDLKTDLDTDMANRLQTDKTVAFFKEFHRTLKNYIAKCQSTGDYSKLLADYANNSELILRNYIIQTPSPNVELKKEIEQTMASMEKIIKEHSVEAIKELGNAATLILDIELFLQTVQKLLEDGEELSKFFDEPIEITAKAYKKMLSLPTIPRDLQISIICNNASKLSAEDLEKIDGKFECKSIELRDRNPQSYTLEQYKMCRAKIDELLADIIIPPSNEPEREKIIFAQVMTKLACHIKYDHDYIDKKHAIDNAINEIEKETDLTEEEKKKKKEPLQKQEQELDHITPRNMIGGLLHGESVCSGYAEILRNVLACCGIKCNLVAGIAKEENEGRACLESSKIRWRMV